MNTEADERSRGTCSRHGPHAHAGTHPIGELARLCERVRLLDRAALLITRLEHQLEVG